MFANNETGDLLPIKEIGELLKIIQSPFMLMLSKQLGKVPVYPEELGIDFLSASAHKFHGPQRSRFSFMRPSQILIISSMVGIRKVR